MADHGDYRVYVESFNRNTRILTTDLAKRYPLDPVIDRAQKRIMTVIDLNPLFVIKVVGSSLFAYRDQIYAKDLASFLGNTFRQELNEGVKEEKVAMVAHIIPKAKECMASISVGEREQYWQLVTDLLDDYVEYLAVAPEDNIGVR